MSFTAGWAGEGEQFGGGANRLSTPAGALSDMEVIVKRSCATRSPVYQTPNFTRRDLQDVKTPKALTHGRGLAEHIEDLDWDDIRCGAVCRVRGLASGNSWSTIRTCR